MQSFPVLLFFCVSRQYGPSEMGSTLKRKNLLQEEQILSFKS